MITKKKPIVVSSGRKANVEPDFSTLVPSTQATVERLRQLLKHLDQLPLPTGEEGSALLDCMELADQIREKVRAKAREVLSEQPDAIPGWGLVPGATVRALGDSSAREAWALLKAASGLDLSLSEFLSCCTVSLRALEEWLIDKEGVNPEQAKVAVNRALEELISYRENRLSLRRLNVEEAYAQREMLEEGREETE